MSETSDRVRALFKQGDDIRDAGLTTPTEVELAADAAASDDGAVGTGDSAAADARTTGQSAAGTLVAEDDAAVLVDGYYNSSMAYSKNVGYAHIHTADYYWLTTEITPAA